MTQSERLFNIVDGPGKEALISVLGSVLEVEFSFFEGGSRSKHKMSAWIQSLEDESRGAGDCWKFIAIVDMPYGDGARQQKRIQGYYSTHFRIGQFTFVE